MYYKYFVLFFFQLYQSDVEKQYKRNAYLVVMKNIFSLLKEINFFMFFIYQKIIISEKEF